MQQKQQIELLESNIKKSHKIVFFGGAGVSTESGIPDFRGAQGIFEYVPEEILSHDFFFQNPKLFYQFYKKHLIFQKAKPNNTHTKLAEWEKEGKLLAVITQNIDGLHQGAGSQNVLELHGSVHRNYCTQCQKSYTLEQLLELLKDQDIPLCSCGSIIKPDVVLYGESLNSSIIEQTIESLEKADLCIVGGTSLSVYPAAGFLRAFKNPERLFVINNQDISGKTSSLGGGHFILSSLGEIFSKLP